VFQRQQRVYDVLSKVGIVNLQPWQSELLKKMTQYKGRGLIQITGRNSGKSAVSAAALQRMMNDIHSRPIEDIILSEGKVYGARYYTAEPIGGNWLEMEAWCYETFGNDTQPIWGESKAPEPAQRWYKNARKFWFRNEADRTMFVLKWR
jgi:hypothetical protein